MPTNNEYIIQLRADTRDINAKLAEVGTSINAISKHTESVEKIGKASWAIYATGLNQVVSLAQTAARYVGQFFNAVSQAAKAGEDMQILAEKTDMSVESLSAIKYAATLVGVELDRVGTATFKLSKAMYEAAAGQEKTQAVFKTLGVAYQDSSGDLRDTGEVLMDIAAKFSTMEDGAAKAALAQKVFGKSGAELIPLMNNLQELGDEARRLGVVMTTEQAQSLATFDDSLDKIKITAEGVKREFYAGLAPALTDIAEAFLEARKEGLDFDAVIEGLSFSLKALATISYDIVNGIVAFKRSMGKGLTGDFAGADEVMAKWSANRDVFMERLWGENQNPPKDEEPRKGTSPKIARSDASKLAAEIEKAREQWTAMIRDMRAETDKLGMDTSDWDKKIIDVNKRYDDAIAKLKSLKMNDAEHIGIIEDYRKKVIDLMTLERDWNDMAEERVAVTNQLAASSSALWTIQKGRLDIEKDVSSARLSLREALGEDVDLQKREVEFTSRRKAILLEIEKLERDIEEAEEDMIPALRANLTVLNLQIPALEEILGLHKKIKEQLEKERVDPAAGWEKGWKDIIKEWESFGTIANNLAHDIAGEMSGTFGEMFFDVMEGRFKGLGEYISNWAKNVLRHIADILGQMAAMYVVKGVMGIPGILGGLSGGASGTYGLGMGGGDFAGMAAAVFHQGGHGLGESGGFRLVPSETFATARRYHSGLTPDEVPLIAQRREMPYIFTPEQMKALGGRGGANINVTANVQYGDDQLARIIRRGVEETVERKLREHF